ncbi:hypothetical protein [Leisingera sp. S232]
MPKKRFGDELIAFALRQGEAGATVGHPLEITRGFRKTRCQT